jgi:hypothetical protein
MTDRRPGHRHGLRHHEEDAGTDGGPDADHAELEQPDRAGELPAAVVRPGLLGHRHDGFASE